VAAHARVASTSRRRRITLARRKHKGTRATKAPVRISPGRAPRLSRAVPTHVRFAGIPRAGQVVLDHSSRPIRRGIGDGSPRGPHERHSEVSSRSAANRASESGRKDLPAAGTPVPARARQTPQPSRVMPTPPSHIRWHRPTPRDTPANVAAPRPGAAQGIQVEGPGPGRPTSDWQSRPDTPARSSSGAARADPHGQVSSSTTAEKMTTASGEALYAEGHVQSCSRSPEDDRAGTGLPRGRGDRRARSPRPGPCAGRGASRRDLVGLASDRERP